MGNVYVSKLATNTVTGLIEPVEMSDTATLSYLDYQPSTLSMGPSDPDVVYTIGDMRDGETDLARFVLPGNMTTWEVQVTVNMAVNFGTGPDRNAFVRCDAYFIRYDENISFPNGGFGVNPITQSTTTAYSANSAAFIAYFEPWTTGNSFRKVTWRDGPQVAWGVTDWLVSDSGYGNTMTATLKLRFDVPSYRSGRCAVSRQWENPYYVRVLNLGEPESGLGDAWELNLLQKPILRNGLTGASPLLPETDYRTTMMGRRYCFLQNNFTDPAELSADISYLRDSDERTVTFTATGDVEHTRVDTLDLTTDDYFTQPYNGLRYCFLRISRSVYDVYGDTVTASISGVRARVIDPT